MSNDDEIARALFDTRTTALYLGGVSRQTVYRLVKSGDLTPINIGSRLMFARTDLDAFIERRKANA